MATTFNLKVVTPEKAFLNEPVERLVFPAPDGEIELLPGHAPMVATQEVGTVRFYKDGAWKEFAASEGFLIVDTKEKEVLLMTQTAEWPEEIDINRARRQREEAEERLRQQRSNQEYHMARAMLTRAMVRMRVGKRGHPRNDAP